MSKRALNSIEETHMRTVIKAVSWRVVATLTTMTNLDNYLYDNFDYYRFSKRGERLKKIKRLI